LIDLHCHILPGLDDGAATMEDSLQLARAAEAAGITTVVATPHIRDDHPFPLELIERRVGALTTALADAEIRVEIVRGAEVALPKLTELDDATLARLCLGRGRYLLVESPYTQAPPLLEKALFDLQVRGFRPVLAHPERSMTFLGDRDRLQRLVERGMLCSVTAMSIAGGFGSPVQAFSLGLFTAGLVHNIASDAHDATRRAPGYDAAFACLGSKLAGDRAGLRWFTDDAARAILDGQHLPTGAPVLRKASGWQRMKARVGLT
jgi:protein-tyrosine phosphatase